MSFNNIEIEGDVKSVETVEVHNVKASSITLECGDQVITIEGKIKKLMKSGGVSSIIAVQVEEPGKAAYQVNTLNSPELKNPDGSPRLETPGTKYTTVPGGKAYQALDPHEGGDEGEAPTTPVEEPVSENEETTPEVVQ